jgi:16S rRNA (cytidine1402-2'-O)-methyltransferase
LYLGFLPLKKGRHTLFTSLKDKEFPVVIYESVHRLESTLEDIQDHFGAEHPVVVARELTKMFEEFVRLPVAQAREHFRKKKPKGEFVILF